MLLNIKKEVCIFYADLFLYINKKQINKYLVKIRKTKSFFYVIVAIKNGDIMESSNINSFLDLAVQLFFIGLAFWSLNDIHLERYVKMHINQYRILIILLSICIGYVSGSFFIWIINITINH